MRRFAALAALVLLGCGEPAAEPPTPAPLDPVDRTAALVWVLDEPRVVPDALAELARLEPTALLFGGDVAPRITEDDPAFDALLADALAAIDGASRRIDLLVEVPALDTPDPHCFDVTDPLADPRTAERVAALGSWLRARPEIAGVVLGFDRDPRPWDAPCSCPACESDLPSALSSRLTTLFEAYATATSREARALWWWDRARGGSVDTAPIMEPAVAAVIRDRDVPLRLDRRLGPDHPWAPESPRLSLGTQRRVAVDIDPAGERFGAGAASLFLADDLYDQVRSHRARSAVGWFIDLAGPDRSVLDDLGGRTALTLLDRLFRDLDLDPTEPLATALGWSDADASPEAGPRYEVAVALRGAGRALDLSTHPLGIAVADVAGGPPASFPLAYVDPTDADPDWAERWFDMEAPSRATLAGIHQWGAEAEALVEDAIAAVTANRDALGAAWPDAESARLRTLQLWVRGWSAAIDADAALRFVQAATEGPERAQVDAWVRSDAARLRAVALAVETDATLATPVPLDPAALRSLADALDLEVGPGDAAPRPFPRLHRIRHSIEDDRYTVRWEVAPAAPGSVEWGNGWPLYDDGGSGGQDPATFWTAWREQPLGPDRRVTYRACAPYEDELGALTVCSSDRLLWTAR